MMMMMMMTARPLASHHKSICYW